MADLYDYPEVTIEGEVYDNTTLTRFIKHYEQLHKATPYALLTGYMEVKGKDSLLWCDACYIADAKGQWFTVCHPSGTFTMRVPEHEQITVTLTTNAEE